MKFLKVFSLLYVNSVDMYNPAFWARESLAVLEENMVAAQLVHRDFEPIIADFGDTINTRKPADLKGIRKDVNDNVTDQDISARNVAVILNQHIHTSFVIKDAQASKALKSLVTEFLIPATIGMSRTIDRIVTGQVYQFLNNSVGGQGILANTNARRKILDAREVMNRNKAPVENRNLIITPTQSTIMLDTDLFTAAQQVGDGGTALQNAVLGRKLGFNIFECQNQPSVVSATTTVTGAINNAGGYPKGTTTFIVNGLSAAIVAGSFITIGGDMTPLRVASTVGGATPTSITVITAATGLGSGINSIGGLKSPVLNSAVVTIYTPGTVNNGPGYALGWTKAIAITASPMPTVGQAVAFNTAADVVYTIIDVDATTITLDRPIEAALTNADKVFFGPIGEFGFAFYRNCMGLVTRPLALPPESTGVRGFVENFGGLSMRAVLTYDGAAQGTRVTLDMLMGIKVYDNALGAVLIG